MERTELSGKVNNSTITFLFFCLIDSVIPSTRLNDNSRSLQPTVYPKSRFNRLEN